MIDAVVHRISIHRLRISMRTKVEHATAEREFSEPIIVAVELLNGLTGYGETLPREYVTGESTESVIRDLQDTFTPVVMQFHARSFPDALEFIDALPWHSADGRLIPAARAAMELALLDASMRAFDRGIDAVVQWMGLAGFGAPGSLPRIRFSGVLASDNDASTMRSLRRMYWFGLRDFKLKVGFDGDVDRVRKVAAYLRRAMVRGKATLRVDANGAWTPDNAAAWISSTSGLGIAAVEQPVARGQETSLRSILTSSSINPINPGNRVDRAPFIIYDESLITRDDAARLLAHGGPIGFNIRISKCGGLLPSLKLASMARRAGAVIQLGCMVGETSNLSAAGLRFLEACPDVRWAEGCFGSFLFADDVTERPLRFGFRGKPPRLMGKGLGVAVSEKLLEKYKAADPVVVNL